MEGITTQGFNERLKRERESERKKLLTELGADDPVKIKTQLTEYQQLKQQAEERRRAEMTEIDRYKADLEKAHQERDEAREEARQARDQVDYEKRDSLIRSTASKYVDDRFIRTARVEFKAYVESLSPPQQAKLTDQQMELWMRKFARENPDFARKPGGETAKPSPAPVLKKPLTNGQTPRKSASPGDAPAPPQGAQKHARDMSPDEVTKLARQSGLKSFTASPQGARPRPVN